MTKHTCGGPAFGKLAPPGDCTRCDELRSGAPARKGWGAAKRERETQQVRAINAHFDSEYHKSGKCGPCCTFGDW